MPNIDRQNEIDAKNVFENFIPNKLIREPVIEFFANALIFAHNLKDCNWNLNLDKKGQFVRFNTGHEYCIEVNSKNTLILCNRASLRNLVKNRELPITYRGHKIKERVHSTNIDGVPDCLSKIPNSVGCVIDNNFVVDILELLEPSNREYINDAIKNTTIIPQSKNAHSKGCIKYFSEVAGKSIPNPSYIK